MGFEVTIIDQIKAELICRANPERAVQQQAYMKSVMPFYGVPVPEVRSLTRAIAKAHKPNLEVIEKASRQLWDEASYREERYAALALTGLSVAKGRLELVDLYEYQVRAGAWWDITDEIAHRIADLHDAWPDQTGDLVRRWAVADTFWLRRLAIISQLQRHQRTDAGLLAEVIEVNINDNEFFIRKAIGWALRDYAKSNPDWVRAFVAAHDNLSPLSQKEALKHL